MKATPFQVFRMHSYVLRNTTLYSLRAVDWGLVIHVYVRRGVLGYKRYLMRPHSEVIHGTHMNLDVIKLILGLSRAEWVFHSRVFLRLCLGDL